MDKVALLMQRIVEKDLVKNVAKLTELGFEITLHDKMPDVVLYREEKDWILKHIKNFRSHWHGRQKFGLQKCQSI